MKRLTVRFLPHQHYSGMFSIPDGKVFKAVEFLDSQGTLMGVMIRGSNLVKAGAVLTEPALKEYYFSLGLRECPADVEIIDDSSN